MRHSTLYNASQAGRVLAVARTRLELAYPGIASIPLGDALPVCVSMPFAVLVDDAQGLAVLPWLAAAAPTAQVERALADADLLTATELVRHGDSDGAIRLAALALARPVAFRVSRQVVPCAMPATGWVAQSPPPEELPGPDELASLAGWSAWQTAYMTSLVLASHLCEASLLEDAEVAAVPASWRYAGEDPDHVHALPTRTHMPTRLIG
jgi:hypothetical protein